MKPLQLDFSRTALVIIDLQKGIVGLNGKPHDNKDVIANSVALANAFRERGGLVTLVRVDFLDGKDALQPITDQEAAVGGERPADWAEIIPELGPEKGDLIITKRNWGAFYGTELDMQLRRRGIDTLVMCGIATNIGVETTAREAFQHNYQQVFVMDAMNGLSQEEHDHSEKYIFPRMGRIRSTKDILDELNTI